MTTDAISRLQAAMERGAAARPKAGGFPYLAESLRQAGVTHCRMAVPANAFLYLTEHGDVVVQGEPLVTGFALAPRFDEAALVAALRADQAGETTFPAFVRACSAGDRPAVPSPPSPQRLTPCHRRSVPSGAHSFLSGVGVRADAMRSSAIAYDALAPARGADGRRRDIRLAGVR
ncbi:hypothetical protein ACFU5B_21920 [Streptomyces murinus]|uniref:hypothetical protein n=1 Tax=Streptomyces murinus TaxID=33900 RepID=UPI0036445C18